MKIATFLTSVFLLTSLLSFGQKRTVELQEKPSIKPIGGLKLPPKGSKNPVYIGGGIKANYGKQNLIPITEAGSEKPEKQGGEINPKAESSPDNVVICRVARQKFKADYNNLYLIQPDANILPGMIISGNAFQEGQFKPVQIKNREPYQITARSADESKSSEVKVNSISGINDVLTTIRPRSSSNPMSSMFKEISVESASEFKLGLSMAVDQQTKAIGLMGSQNNFSLSVNNRSKKVSKYFLLQYAETLFTATIDQPEMLNGLAYYCSDALPTDAAIIKEVGYGRLLYFLVKVEAKESDMGMALSFLQKASTDVKLASTSNSTSFNGNVQNTDVECKIEVTAFGAGIGVNPIAITDFNQLRSELGSMILSNRGRSAVPIYYKLARAYDYQELSTKIIDESEVRDCKINKGTFRVSFDNVVAWETEEVGNDELFGIGWCEMKITDKDGLTVDVPLSAGKYVDAKQPRVFSISPDKHVSVSKGDGFTLDRWVEYTIDAATYGYGSLEEALANTKVSVRVELKEEDNGSDQTIGKVASTPIPLNKAYVPKRTMSELKNSRNSADLGILKFQSGGGRYGVSYSIIPIE